MNIENKLIALDSIYRIYDEFIQSRDFACERLCANCCTCNMTLTTLEGYRILCSLEGALKRKLLDAIHAVFHRQRFQPKLTFNQIAGLCMDGRSVPDEPMEPDWGTCPFLLNQACPIYPERPFGCRCMVSKVRCDKTGYADIDEFVLTVNNLFLQYIEHIDTPGMTGNLVDVFRFFESENNQTAYGSAEIPGNPENLIFNSPIPVIMIPPRHRKRIHPILKALRDVLEE
jgi:Fe-S-cluster containining protein